MITRRGDAAATAAVAACVPRRTEPSRTPRCQRACSAASATFRDKTNSLHGSLARGLSSNYDYRPPSTLFSESHLSGFQRRQQCAKDPAPSRFPLCLSTVLKGNKGLLIHSNRSNHLIIYYICLPAFVLCSASYPTPAALRPVQ